MTTFDDLLDAANNREELRRKAQEEQKVKNLELQRMHHKHELSQQLETFFGQHGRSALDNLGGSYEWNETLNCPIFLVSVKSVLLSLSCAIEDQGDEDSLWRILVHNAPYGIWNDTLELYSPRTVEEAQDNFDMLIKTMAEVARKGKAHGY